MGQYHTSDTYNWSPSRRGKTEKVFEEIMATDFPNLVRTINAQIQEVQSISSRRIVEKMIPRHIKTNLLKTSGKEKILKTAREKRQIIYRTKIRMTATFSRNCAGQETIE